MIDPTLYRTPTPALNSLGPVRRSALFLFRPLGALTLIAGVVQIGLAGLGAFGASFEAHRVLGSMIGLASLALLVLMLVARPDLRAVLLTVVVAALAFGVQPLLANLGGGTDAWFGALHALSALALMGRLGKLTAQAGRLTDASSPRATSSTPGGNSATLAATD